ncbi:hypothetical protein [Roseovarius sp. D22-M7]|uniref:hypothetical protein n=1 Tax=Roseovarius sp. D22-M7 TaxID=3127116 RepID=UPI00300FFD9D
MTRQTETTGLQHARDLTRHAAQWLQLLRFRSRPGVTPFSASMCHYHAMLDPGASDLDRLASCRTMVRAVERRRLAEEFVAEADETRQTLLNPYHLHWETTRDGAALWAIANLLCEAIEAFEAEQNAA